MVDLPVLQPEVAVGDEARGVRERGATHAVFSHTKHTDELIVPSSASSRRTSPYVSRPPDRYIELHRIGLFDPSHQRIAVLAQLQRDFPLQNPVLVHAVVVRDLLLFGPDEKIGLDGSPARLLLPLLQLGALGEIVFEQHLVDAHHELMALDEPTHLRLEVIALPHTHMHRDGFEIERPRGGDVVLKKVAIVEHIANLRGTRHALLLDGEAGLLGGSSLRKVQQRVLSHHADGHLQQQTAHDHASASLPALQLRGTQGAQTLQ